MTENPPPRHGGDYDQLWIIGIIGALGYGAFQAVQNPAAQFAAARGLMWADTDGWHAEPLAWVTLVAAVGAIGGGGAWLAWASAARRWKRSQLGAIPRPPAIAAGLFVAGAVWLLALVLVGTIPVLRGIAASVALAAGGGAWAWARRYRTRLVAQLLFTGAITGQLGFAQPGLAKVQAGRWLADEPGAIRATTGPGWRATSSEYAALDRAAAEAGWHGPYAWRSVTAARVVIGERAQ